MSSNTLATVDFHGTPLTVITTQDGAHLVAMQPICEAIGLHWGSQYNRIMRDDVLSTSIFIMKMEMPGDDQVRSIACLPLDYLNGWLFGIDTARCREAIRPRLTEYKRECYRALADYWLKGEARNPRTEPAGYTLTPHDANNLAALLSVLDNLRPLLRSVAKPLRAMQSPLAGQLEDSCRNIAMGKLTLGRLGKPLSPHKHPRKR